jgi:hypothetical protein
MADVVGLTPFTLQLAPRLSVPWIVLAGGAYLVYRFLYVEKGTMTPERQAVFALAMHSTDPNKLGLMADAFQKAGLSEQATALRNRANLPNLSQQIQINRANIVKQSLNSTNPDAIEDVADAFASQGATATADLLRNYAQGLRNSQNVQPLVATPATTAASTASPPAASPPESANSTTSISTSSQEVSVNPVEGT